jgi:hypothetical protein
MARPVNPAYRSGKPPGIPTGRIGNTFFRVHQPFRSYPMKAGFIATLFLAASLSACQSTPPAPAPAPKPAPMPAPVGGDRDAHGCIAAAGYQWCASMNRCVRAWEVLPADSAKPEEAFKKLCSAPAAKP